MSLRKLGVALLPLIAVVGASDRSEAGVLGWLFHDITSGAVGGATEKLEPVLGRTLADVDTRLANHERRIGNILESVVDETSTQLGDRLDQVDGILEKRLLDVRLGVEDVLDHGLDKIDGVARKRLAQIDKVLAARIDQVDAKVAKAMKAADKMLEKNIANVGHVVNGAIDKADGAIAARIEQVDELAGRRLGNVDVIASKQRLGLEQTITRSAWLIGLVVFVLVVLKALWSEYLKREEEFARLKPGTQRAAAYVVVLGKPLLRHAAVAGVIGLLLATVPQRLPMAAVQEQKALAERHTAELERSVAQLDWTRVRFHASQLEFLEPDDAPRYKALAAKAELLRDVLERPTALASATGVVATLEKVQAVERMQVGRPDPDVLTVRAMLLWQRGNRKAQEHAAATLAARALWSSPRGFTLAPMAKMLVEAYLHAPDPFAPEPATRAVASDGDDELESNEGLVAALAIPLPDAPGSPFEGASALFHLMLDLDSKSSAAFVRMVAAQREVAAKGLPADAVRDARKRRNDAAEDIVTAWHDFDVALMERPILAGNPTVLGVFRLNDVLLTHALWYTTQESTNSWPRRLAELATKTPDDRRLKLAIAPARAVWARRYAGLLQGPARELLELQEARRFEELEAEVLAFEGNYDPPEEPAIERPEPRKRLSPEQKLRRLEAATAASALNLYDGKDEYRTPLAKKISADLVELREKTGAALGDLKKDTDAQLVKIEVGANQKLQEKVNKALETLRGRLLGRATRLI